MVEEARAHFSEGMKHYDQGAFAAAKIDFEKAYELAPSYKLLYNLGLVYRQLDDAAQAIRSLESYLAQGAWEIPDDRVAEVTKILSELTPRVASAKVTANLPGVVVSVDDRFVGQTPTEDVIVLNPGQHRIVGKQEGRISDTQIVTANAGEFVKIDLALKELPREIPFTRVAVVAVLFGVLIGLVLRALRNKKAPVPAPEAGK